MAAQEPIQCELFGEGQPRFSGQAFTLEQELAICDDYDSGLSAPEVARKWNCGHRSVFRFMKKHGRPTRSISVARKGKSGKRPKGYRARMPLRCSLDEEIFDHIPKNKLATYWAGLMFADGNVSVEQTQTSRYAQRKITLRLAKEDEAMVHAFRDFLGSSHKIRTVQVKGGFSAGNSYSAALTVTSDQLADRLMRWGVLPQKSGKEIPPPELCFNREWWRGVVDGDGWVYFDGKGVPRVGVCGSRATCEAFRELVRTITPTEANIQPNATIWSFAVAHNHAIRVAAALYEGCDFALERKWDAARQMIATGREKGLL